jgi:hypothetical protein
LHTPTSFWLRPLIGVPQQFVSWIPVEKSCFSRYRFGLLQLASVVVVDLGQLQLASWWYLAFLQNGFLSIAWFDKEPVVVSC